MTILLEKMYRDGMVKGRGQALGEAIAMLEKDAFCNDPVSDYDSGVSNCIELLRDMLEDSPK